jgi:hypothetical protein
MQKMIPLQPPSPVIVPLDEKHSQSGEAGRKAEENTLSSFSSKISPVL